MTTITVNAVRNEEFGTESWELTAKKNGQIATLTATDQPVSVLAALLQVLGDGTVYGDVVVTAPHPTDKNVVLTMAEGEGRVTAADGSFPDRSLDNAVFSVFRVA